MKLSELKKMAAANGISLKHLNGKMLKKSELAEKLMNKGVMVKSPKKSRKASRKKSRKPKKKSRKLNAYMTFAAKHRKNVMKKFKDQGKKGRDLISATGKELGKMYRAQKPKASRKMSKKKSRKASKKKSKKKKSRKKKSRKKKKSREYKMHKYGGNEGDLRRSARKDYM